MRERGRWWDARNRWAGGEGMRMAGRCEMVWDCKLQVVMAGVTRWDRTDGTRRMGGDGVVGRE